MPTVERIFADIREELDRAAPAARELMIRALVGLLEMLAADNDDERWGHA